MRPVRIELEGFSAYRDRIEVDFSDVEFFSLAGPTGSGKSSLIDAMVFALFGRVPRLGGNAVAPAITAGTDRARVRFDFEVNDVVYTAVREARRTPSGGASVREARLQREETVLADGADYVTAEVEDLLKLRFDDFTRTVVLPQGDFARFLRATKSERQGLLRNLLGLDIYTRMRELARTRAAVASERADGAKRTLESLDLADEETRRGAVHRVDALSALSEQLPLLQKELDKLDRACEEVRDTEKSLDTSMARLRAISAPDRLEDLETLAEEARSRVVEVDEACAEAGRHMEAVEQSLADLPSKEQILVWKKSRSRLHDFESLLAADDLVTAEQAHTEAVANLDGGLVALERARASSLEVRTRHAAHLLTQELVPGEPCPVCASVVTEVPQRETLPELGEVDAAEKAAESVLDGLRSVAEATRTELTKVEAKRAGWAEQRELLVSELAESPSSDELAEMEGQLADLTQRLELARDMVKRTEEQRKKAQEDLDETADASRSVAKRLVAAQLTVAELEPPVSESDDVVVQWKDLLTWRDQTLERLTSEREAAVETRAEYETRAQQARRELTQELIAHDVSSSEPYAVQVATALQEARAVVTEQEKAEEASTRLAAEAKEAEKTAAVATTLANHLKANGFEQWLMAGALADLVAGANALLAQLSDGGYSLHSDESGTFSIVDHRSADEMRSVSTLSGGETFLVSLALALSLAETLAAKGGSGLESIILDEGFGTLDEESLDTVASVLEELTGRGLMVGVITHVKELAARAPVRYEVARESTGAKVRLVS